MDGPSRIIVDDTYRNVFENAAIGMAIIAHSGQWLIVNRSFCNLVGYLEDELFGLKFHDIAHPDDEERNRNYAKQLSSGKLSNLQTDERYIHKSGHIVWLRLTVSAVRNARGEVLYFNAQFQDIPEYRQAVKAQHDAQQEQQLIVQKLEESEQRYTLLLKELKSNKDLLESFFTWIEEAIIILDMQGKVLQVNKAFEQMYGWTEREVVGKPLLTIPHSLSAEIDRIYDKIKAGEQVNGFETLRQRKDGSLIDTSITVSPIRDANNDVVAISSIARDITDRKRAEEALQESDQRYRRMVKLSPEPIVVHREGILVYVNDAAVELAGVAKKDDLIGKPIADFVHPEYLKGMELRINEMDNEKASPFTELKIIRLDGQVIDVEASSIGMIQYMGKNAIQSVIRDISERKRTEELLRKSDKLSVIGQLAAGLAHEIRNPLTALKGFVQLLKSKATENLSYYEIMLSELDRINNIVNEFMLLATPRQFMNLEKQDVGNLVLSIVSVLNSEAIMNNVQIFVEDEPGIPVINCDEYQMKQVFMNIMKNAIESMPDGGNLIIQLKAHHNDQILIRFTDQGCGIPAGEIAKLGEPFYTTKETGTGLGLMMCYKIVEAHQGKLIIESVENKGTTIDINLPVACLT